jgi:hypothetical protein
VSNPVAEKMTGMADGELSYVAIWVGNFYQEIAAEALDALARYKREHPDTAKLLEQR